MLGTMGCFPFALLLRTWWAIKEKTNNKNFGFAISSLLESESLKYVLNGIYIV